MKKKNEIQAKSSEFVISNSVGIRNIIVNVRVKSSYPVMPRVFSRKFAFSLVVLFIEPYLPIAQSTASEKLSLCATFLLFAISAQTSIYESHKKNAFGFIHFYHFCHLIMYSHIFSMPIQLFGVLSMYTCIFFDAQITWLNFK